MKKLVLLIIFVFFLFCSMPVLAQEGNQNINSQESSVEINSFEVFWPISAGKTVSDSFYWLKSLKEQIRGLLIFGSLQKADYFSFLTVKRIIETEKLLTENKTDMANKTLEKSLKNLEIVEVNIDKYLNEGFDISSSVDLMKSRLENLAIFIPQLKDAAKEDNIILLNNNLEKIQIILNKI